MPESKASRITVLDEHTANRIAAGEVVERPASVVKELVENAIDAGATQITVTLEQGGRELIKVVDNGCGMTREDAVLSLQRHATSKIATAEDLSAISTLGFRGEALPSIASVSIMEIITKHAAEPEGVRLEVEAGTITNLEPVGAPQGTTVLVRSLFFNTPARLKFLKSPQTELSHIVEHLGWFAMAYPTIHFRLIHNSREVLASPASGSALTSIAQVMGKDVVKRMTRIEHDAGIIRVDGYVSVPSLTRINRRDQVFFVNGRPIRSKLIAHAVDQAYRGLLQPGRYPVVVVFITLSPDLVDVNVHPTKSEVKFSNEQEVHRAVYAAVNTALMEGAAAETIVTPDRSGTPYDGTIPSQRMQPPFTLKPDDPSYRQAALRSLSEMELAEFQQALAARRNEAIQSSSQASSFVWEPGKGVPVEESPVPDADFDEVRTVALRGVRVIGQAHSAYIVAQCDDGLLIIDQHVAHERVIFDKLIKTESEHGPAVQGLVVPITVSLSARESAVVSKRLNEIRKSGFDLEEFGQNTFVLRGAPALVKPQDAETVLRDVIQELVDLSVTGHMLVRPDQVLITAACKFSIKAGDPLTTEEMTRLIEDLLSCENPFVCPHGRPIIISLPSWELERKFRRS